MVVGMLVDGRCAGVEPDAWRGGAVGEGNPKNTRRVDTRIHDELAIPSSVAAINTDPGEIDERRGVSEFSCPRAQGAAIPAHFASVWTSWAGIARENHHLMSLRGKPSGERSPQKPAATRDDDLLFHVHLSLADEDVYAFTVFPKSLSQHRQSCGPNPFGAGNPLRICCSEKGMCGFKSSGSSLA